MLLGNANARVLCFAKLGSLQARDDSENYMILKYLQIIWVV
jgi:hypothetical protein